VDDARDRPEEGRVASANLREAASTGVAAIVAGDAAVYLRARKDPFDFVFLDAEKEDYAAYLDVVVPLLSPGGVLVADNLLSHERT